MDVWQSISEELNAQGIKKSGGDFIIINLFSFIVQNKDLFFEKLNVTENGVI